MIKGFVIGLVCFTGLAHANECQINPEELGAYYSLQETNTEDQSGKLVRQRELSLWRHSGLVAHVHQSEGLADIWSRQVNGWMRPVRFFDEAKRGIEYQATEVNGGRGEKDWSLRYQLVSERMLGDLSLTETVGEGCDRMERYTGTIGKAEIELVWKPAVKLVSDYREKRPNKVIAWSLVGLELEPEKIEKEFKARESWQTTDYADIGDNESDPFLLSLIHQGFVSHGASGFYEASGRMIEGGHRH